VLKVHNVSKTYDNGKEAVRGLNLTFYKDQISCLLGHNGAGKTTTFSMLTGMLEFTSGEGEVFGKNIVSEMDDIRGFMGICPQHNILFDDLTVEEHLEMFANFKGMDSAQIEAEVQQMIRDVDLWDKKDDLSKNLSGGQKRRLSIAIAFIGGSKLIYLDEPSSGMDTSARRSLWEMLKKYKTGRIIVLTTHFMDEADYLGDRIAIMGNGQLICCGSSVFLKNQFGVGYNLTVVKTDPKAPSTQIEKFIASQVEEYKMLSDVSAEMAF
jgi:ATP-binding cassette, subfamily A (ABC1), member 3